MHGKLSSISRIARFLVVGIIVILLGVSSALAEEYQDYKQYKSKQKDTEYFEVGLEGDQIVVTAFSDGQEQTMHRSKKSIRTEANQVTVGDGIVFDNDALTVGGERFPYDNISKIRVFGSDDYLQIKFYRLTDREGSVSKVRRGNFTRFGGQVSIEDDDFIRGFVFTVAGDIEVYGEVNEDVISLFGDIYIGSGAVVRGDVATITGRADLARDASAYGEIYTGDEQRTKRRHRFSRHEDMLTVTTDFKYNRVDGAVPYMGLRFEDPDSVLPVLYGQLGYGFASDRWRYDFGFEQVLIRHFPIAIGGSVYRRLASDDDWLLNDAENTTFALVVNEDFKDYYEAEGGSLFLRAKPMSHFEIEARYRYEETNWLRSHSKLWSLFGKNKDFNRNFGRVYNPYRSYSIGEIDTTTNAYMDFQVTYDARDKGQPYSNSAWQGFANLQWSNEDLQSDFDYRRYSMRLTRLQKVNRRAMLIMSAMYGGSDGYLPMYKRFYLGGLGTLYGYYHKEFMGSRFWMANAEYRIDFPRSDLSASVFWDAGRITNNTKFTDDDEVRHDIGLGIYIGNDFKVNIAKRLDSSGKDDPKVYVRLTSAF